MSCVCVKKKKEYLRLYERGLKGMSSEFKESKTTSKMTNRPGVSEGVVKSLWAEMLMYL